jgi:DNA-binding NtrC family response regulator
VVTPPSRADERASLLAEGVEEIIEEPVDVPRLVAKLDLLRQRRRLIDDLGLVVRDSAMLELLERVLRVAPLKVTVLVTGESGTGKELLAQAVHRASDRRDGPFVPVNVGALPENLLESELFGHEKGAFTSADARRIGRFEMADHGTLFLDEIGEMPLPAQVNLLRVLEEERFLRVGGSTPLSVDVRIVAATNRDLEEMVRSGRFRRDLYYRLNVVHLRVPPLRERTSEIPLLARELAARAAKRHGLHFPGFGADALRALQEYSWPGNVRELRNIVDGLVALRPEGPLRREDLPSQVLHGHGTELAARPLPALSPDRSEAEREFIFQSLLALRAEVASIKEMLTGRPRDPAPRWTPEGDRPRGGAIYPTGPVRVESHEDDDRSLSLQDLERRAVERALRESRGNRRLAAETLGISERTLYRRIKQFGIQEG